MIADNKLTENATWDDQLLAQQLKNLSLLGLDFSLEITGLEMGEIDLRIASLQEVPVQDDPADVLPESPAGSPVSKIGDPWILGDNRVLCGSALDTGSFTALMGQERAAMVFTDPPYNVPIEGHASGLGAIHHRPFPMASARWPRPNSPSFSLDLAATSPHSVPARRCTTSAWTGATWRNCWRPAQKPTAS